MASARERIMLQKVTSSRLYISALSTATAAWLVISIKSSSWPDSEKARRFQLETAIKPSSFPRDESRPTKIDWDPGGAREAVAGVIWEALVVLNGPTPDTRPL